MANTPKPIRKAAKANVAATKEELKKPSVTYTGSGKQSKAGKSFVKTFNSDKKNYVGKKVQKTVAKAEKRSK